MSEYQNAAFQTPNPSPGREHPNAASQAQSGAAAGGGESWPGAGPAGYQNAPPPAHAFYPPPYPYPYPPPGYYPPPAAPYWSSAPLQHEGYGYGYGYGEPYGPNTAASAGHTGAGYGAGHGARVSDLVNEVAGGGSGLSSLTRMLDLDDIDLWKGALVGAAAVLLLTNRSVQSALFGAKAERTDDA